MYHSTKLIYSTDSRLCGRTVLPVDLVHSGWTEVWIICCFSGRVHVHVLIGIPACTRPAHQPKRLALSFPFIFSLVQLCVYTCTTVASGLHHFPAILPLENMLEKHVEKALERGGDGDGDGAAARLSLGAA